MMRQFLDMRCFPLKFNVGFREKCDRSGNARGVLDKVPIVGTQFEKPVQ